MGMLIKGTSWLSDGRRLQVQVSRDAREPD